MPLTKGVLVVSAGRSTSLGDLEEVMEIVDVTRDEVQIRFSMQAEASGGNRPRYDFNRFVSRTDLASAHSMFNYRANGLPDRFSGTTSFGPSTSVLRELKTNGRSRLDMYLGRPDPPKTLLSVDELLRQNLMSRFSGVVTRVTDVGQVDPVLINGDPMTLPMIRARGVLTNDEGTQLSEDLWILDDPANPITLKSASSVGTHQVTKIFTPSEGDGPNRVDRDLTAAGRANVYGIFFDIADATLRRESEAALTQIANALQSHKEWRLSIEGHTDNVGSDDANQRLSERRADGVKEALITRYHVDSSRLSTRGLGESRPKATNDTLAGRAANRRVELLRTEPREQPARGEGRSDARAPNQAATPSPAAAGIESQPAESLTARILSLAAWKVWILLVVLAWVAFTVPIALFLLLRWRYLRALRRSLYGPGRLDDRSGTAAGEIAIARPPISITTSDEAMAQATHSHLALVSALADTRRMRTAYALGGVAYMLTATVLVWYERSHNGVSSPHEAIYVAYVTTAPSVVLILACLRARWSQIALATAAWIALLLLLLVGVFRVEWRSAFNLLIVDAAPLALFPVAGSAFLLLRTTRAMLVVLLPVTIGYALVSALMTIGLGVMGVTFSNLLEAFTVRSLVTGALTSLAGIAIGVMQIRSGVRLRSVLVLIAIAGLALLAWPRQPWVAIASVPLNALQALAIWWLFKQFVRMRARGYLTDDLLHFSTCWFILLYFVQSFSGTRWVPVPSALLPFAAYALVLLPMLRYLARARSTSAVVFGTNADRPKRLLLLRVFSSARIRRRLIDTIDDSWRRVGRVDVVVGVDLALRTLNTATLEAVLLGRMSRRFLGSESEVRNRLAVLSDERMADGLYSVNELHCLPHIWPEVVRRLVTDADVVLMDLRRLRSTNTGALFELSLAIQVVPLDRIVLLVDAQTDERAVVVAIEHAWARLPSDSPNVSARTPQVRWLLCRGSHLRQDRRIREAIFAAAFDVAHPIAVPAAVYGNGPGAGWCPC